jgi:acetolactate synthase I/II/III large subunit
MKIKVSDLVTRFLEEQNVKHVFLLSGGMMMHLLDSISKSKKIRYICNHHEQACAMAAEGNARWRGGLGVCFATSGPGATNTVTGITGAWLDSSPVLFITGQSRRTLTARGLGLKDLRMVGTFEVDIVPIVRPITKYSVFVDDPKSVLYHLQKAVYLAQSGRPGPVLLDMPLDVQGAMVEEDDFIQFVPEKIEVSADDYSAIWAKLAVAQRPVILAGHGIRVAGQCSRFVEFVERLGIPLVTTQLANDLIPYAHPHYVGHVGLRGDRAANFTVQAADLLIVLGCSLHITTTGYEVDKFAPSAEKIWIDSDKANLERNVVKAILRYPSSVSDFLHSVGTFKPTLSANVESWNRLTSRWKEKLLIIAEHPLKNDHLETYQLVNTLSNTLTGGETIVTDAGSLYYVIGQAFKTKSKQRVIVSGALGSMGYALPASLGVAVEDTEGTTICIKGDGSMQMNVQELATVARYSPNLKIIVINNGGYASIRNTQVNFCNGNYAGTDPKTGVGLPSWDGLCLAYGLTYMKCDKHSELAATFQNMLRIKGPVFVECIMPETVEMFPAVTSRKLDDGSFVSSRLHEMSPFLSDDQLGELGINKSLLFSIMVSA